MLNDLLSRRVLFLIGKGGVGTTTISAAIASAASRRGGNVLAMECDGRAPMAAAFGVKPDYEPVMVSERLFAMVLDGRHALEEYLRLVIPVRTVLRAVFASRLYQLFVQAAPGLRELMMLGKICYEAERKLADTHQWDLIVVDAPASGQAVSILKMPAAARETFGQSIVGREAEHIAAILRDPRQFAVVLVTTPEPLPVSETIETADTLRAAGIEHAALILNRTVSPPFSARDLAKLREHFMAGGHSRNGEYLSQLARRELDRSTQTSHAFAQLTQHISLRSPRPLGEGQGEGGGFHPASSPTQTCDRIMQEDPIIQLPEFRGLSGRALIERLAHEIPPQMAAAPPDRPALP